MYLSTDNFWVSATGLFVETMCASAWSQPAIGMLAQVVNPNVRGTAVSLFFFFLTVFSIIMPAFYVGIRDHYGIEPIHEPHEFGIFLILCTCIPSLLSIPAFYVAGVRYSWIRFKEMIF